MGAPERTRVRFAEDVCPGMVVRMGTAVASLGAAPGWTTVGQHPMPRVFWATVLDVRNDGPVVSVIYEDEAGEQHGQTLHILSHVHERITITTATPDSAEGLA